MDDLSWYAANLGAAAQIDVSLEIGWDENELPKNGDWAKITVAKREYFYIVRINEFAGFIEPIKFGVN